MHEDENGRVAPPGPIQARIEGTADGSGGSGDGPRNGSVNGSVDEHVRDMPEALSMLASERPRNVGWFQAAALLYGDWGTSRLYVLGLAFLVAGRSAFWLIGAMSLLILIGGWAYTHICRLYPDGGGVFTAGKRRSRLLGVIGALLLFADYTITASLSSIEAFHYFKLGSHHAEVAPVHPQAPAAAAHRDVGDHIAIPEPDADHAKQRLFTWPPSTGLYAIFAICGIGIFNLMGPKHTSRFAVFAAIGMIAITALIVLFAVPQIEWGRVEWGRFWHPPVQQWTGFVYIILALSGVEAIANLTGVMKKPVYVTARKSIWVVAIEVAVFNLVLALVMISLASITTREAHKEDMLAFMARHYIGLWGEVLVRIIAGALLLSATNTAVNGIMSIIYVMSRDGELPAIFQKLNGFGAPWIAAILATSVPIVILLFANDLETLASLYAIGVVGAVAIDTSLAAVHPRLRKWYRKAAMLALGLFLAGVWVTLAVTKIPALIFVTIVLAAGLSLRAITRHAQKRRPKPSLLRRAIIEQLSPEALAKPKILLATAGGSSMAEPALAVAKAEDAALVVCFVRDVALDYRIEAGSKLTLDNDPAAQNLFSDFLEMGHKADVPIIPMYDTGPNSAELIAEAAAINGVRKVLIGSSRRGTLHRFIKGSFQRRLEDLMPPGVTVEVLPADPALAGAAGAS